MSYVKCLAIPALVLAALTQSTSATPASPSSGLATSEFVARQSLVEKAGYGYCWRWNAICRDRWVGGWRYRRCMRAHGC
jgi:hypothetical protein